ncbi:MAG TPA: glycosyltransferase [Spirochaetota bacterium]|nr:glycosyltransferase [Spirochaetota bacterium]
MNIVIFTDTFLPKIDGVAVSVESFSRILSARGHNFVICCPRYGVGDPMELGERVKIVRFSNFSLPSYPDIKVVFPLFRKIREAMTMFPADLVHIQSPGLLGIYGIIAARYYGVPAIGTYHTLVSEVTTYLSPARLLKIDRLIAFYRSLRGTTDRVSPARNNKKTLAQRAVQRLCNWLYERKDLIISPSHRIKSVLEEQNVTTPIEVISNGMDLGVFRGSVKERPSGPPRLLHVGRISFEKNCDVVLGAFAQIHREIPGATLTIVGDGPALESLKAMTGRLGLADRVVFTGFVPRAELPDLYPRYDLFLTASTMETQGLVVLEAIASGLPCVGVDAYALPELIHNGENGFIARPFDPEEMARLALDILGDASRYRAFSAEGLRIASEHEINRCATRLEAVYARESARAGSRLVRMTEAA